MIITLGCHKIRILAFAAVLALIAAVHPAKAYDRGDFQIWNTQVQEAKIHKSVKMVMEEEFRYGENAGELYYQHYDWAAVFAFHKTLDIGLSYRQVYERYKRKWREENEPSVNATFKFDLWKFKLENKNRLEYRHFRYKDDSIRYRNKSAIKYPLDVLGVKAAPYLADEVFISSDGKGFNEDRFFSGIEVKPMENLAADVYYLLKLNRISGDKWTGANVLGMKVKISF